MFYSHEILTSRRHGVATVWLVATLGAKSKTKKLTRKAILDVDVRKACETIMQPEAPMALRLQSNLLFGVSRVYSQQCGYVLADTQAAQNSMRALLKVVRDHGLDPEAGRARPDQLILLDDPAFLPDMALPLFDFDLSNFDVHVLNASKRSSQSSLSPHDRGQPVSSAISLPGFHLGSGNSSSGQYQLPINDPFAESSARKQVEIAGNLVDDEAILFQDDDLFELDADGNLHDISTTERERRQTANQGHPGSDSAASRRVRKEHEDALAGRANIPGFEDFNIMQFGDDEIPLPDAESFPVMSRALQPNVPRLLASEGHTLSQESSSVSAEAPAKRRKAKVPKVLKNDFTLEHRNADLLQWQHAYVANMAEEIKSKAKKKRKIEANKNAYIFVYGCGIQDVGNGMGGSQLPHPLQMFSGGELIARITGEQSLSPIAKRGVKRVSEDEDEESRKRYRPSEELREEVGRGDDEPIVMIDEDTGVEVGRDAEEALPDYPSSAMPWNVSASLHSHQRGASSSAKGPGFGSQLRGSARRHPSASPLIGRGSNLPGDLERFNQSQDNAPVMFGRDDEEDDDVILRRGASRVPMSGSQTAQEFELYGPAAAVDTQTAGASQWVREALDKESNNFLEFVRNTINEKTADELVDEEEEKFVTFEELFNPDKNSRIVAAQAFHHVLTMATKNKIWVEQDVGSDEPDLMEAFGEMRIGVKDY